MAGLFTRILRGEIPSYKIHEDANTYAFLAKDQVTPGHTLIIPKVEVDYWVDVPEPQYSAVFQNARKIARALKAATGCTRVGTCILGFDVPHFHYHLIPMDEIADLDFSRATEYQPDAMEQLRKQIVGALKELGDA